MNVKQENENKKRVLAIDEVGHPNDIVERYLKLYCEIMHSSYFEKREGHCFYSIGQLKEQLKTIKEQEQRVITRRFGLNGAEPVTQDAIAKMENVTSQMIGRIERTALNRMRHSTRLPAFSFGTIEELSAELERMKNLYADALAENEHAVEVPLTIDELDLSSKVYGILKFRKLDVVEEIVALGNISALKKIRGLGENSYKEIVTKLETVGVTLDEDGKFVVGNLQVGQISSTRPSTLDFSEEDISIKEAQLEACQDAYERRMSTDERMQMIVAIHEQVALIEETMGRLNDDSYMETEVFDIEAYIVTVTDNRMSLNEMPIEGLETLLNTLNGYINKLEAKINAVSIRGAEENVRS